MTMPRIPWLLVVGLAVVVGLPLLGRWVRGKADPGCALDGTRIDPIYRVEVIDSRGDRQVFCCLGCAQLWLRRHGAAPRAITVTDETTGESVDAATAWYARSSVVTNPATGNRLHAFRTQADAESHAAAFAGMVLPFEERPFRPRDR